jgi:heme/copper-type cytochrome/quinol oxidase subunit 4
VPELMVWLCIVALTCFMFMKGGAAFRWIVGLTIVLFFGGLVWIFLEEHL